MTNQSDIENSCCGVCGKWVGLCVLIAMSLVLLIGYGYLGFLTSTMHPDSEGYIHYQWDLSEKGLNGVRTPGYPIFLHSVMAVFGLEAIPLIHDVVYFLAVIYFYYSLLAIGFRSIAALAVAVPLLLGLNPTLLAPNILTDSLALSLSIVCLAAFNYTWASRASIMAWIWLATITFITYQVRPAYLFILVLWPLAGVWTTFFLGKQRGSFTACIRPLLAYLAVSVIPFFGYAILRGIFTGYFGIVAFGGYNTIGIAVQFLDADTISKLPDDLQDFGKAILKKIEEEKIKVDVTSYYTMEPNYPNLVYQVSVPVATEMYGKDVRKINTAFNRISLATFRIHPKLYLRWLIGNWKHAVSDQANLTFRNLGTVLILLLVGLSICRSLWQGSRTPRNLIPLPIITKPTEPHPSTSQISISQLGNSLIANSSILEFQYLFWLSLWYSLGKTSLVSLVEPTVGRYMAPASLLWPSILALVALQFVRFLQPASRIPS